VLLRPDLRPPAATQLTIAAATALARAIRQQTQALLEIKWPNDIMVQGKKAAGILTELRAELDRINYLIVGIGVNVNFEPHEFLPELRQVATSLKIATGRPVNRADLAVAALRELDQDYGRIRAGRFAELANEWERQCATLGRHVSIRLGDRVIQGQAESLDNEGALLLRTQHGRLERVVGGDVTLEKQ
jgi:BirA family biotin operon repressor/biotin-[acetyl-CoA-carboxylase] ligase